MARDGFLEHYVLGLRSSTKHNSTAYGYTIAMAATYGAVARIDKAPSLLDVFMFIVGASAAFALINATATAGFRAEMPSEPAEVVALGTSFSIVSISATAGAAIGVAYALWGWLAWLAGSFTATLVYVLLVGLELGLAARAHPRGARGGR
jgi:hypothetical protein